MAFDWISLTDGDLATLSLAGRQPAFAELVRRHQDAVFRLVCAWIGDPCEALDVTQEAFVAAHRALARYDAARSMRAWLSAIALNKCRDWARKRAVRRLLSFAGPIDARAEAVADEQVPTDDIVADRQELALVTRLIARLPDTLKTPLVLRTVEGLSQAETAEVLSISEKAVETRLYRARAKLAEKLRDAKG